MTKTSLIQTTSNSPYPGLRPYHEDEKDNFFGRNHDCQVLNDKILANRLTLLFAATGVGKSSLLQAAIIPKLKAPLGDNLDVVYYMDWVSNPLHNLKQTVLASLQQQGKLETVDTETQETELAEFFEFCCLFSSQPLIIILDQFEEFFRYQRGKAVFQPFITQLITLILDKSIPISLVISMREDYALELNAFKSGLPMMLFENYYRLEKLTRQTAEDAITIPAQKAGFSYEPKLFKQLLKDLLSRDLDRSKGSNIVAVDIIETVEPPYLQIICSQLWQLDQNAPDKIIRLQTYKKAGGAQGLLKHYIDEVQSGFSFAEKKLSSKAFDHLISRRGTKMAYTAEDLAQTLRVKDKELHQVFAKLTELRVLRSQQREEKIWYELYHDMFSDSIEEWNHQWKNKMRVRRTRNGLIELLVAVGVLYIGYDAIVNYSFTHLRMNLNDPYSSVELYQGKAKTRDIFNQQKYLAQTPIQLKDREPDKRLPDWPVRENGELNTELINTLSLSQRVVAFEENGKINRALKIAKDSIQDANPSRSLDIINSLINTQTRANVELFFIKLKEIQRKSLIMVLQNYFFADSIAILLSHKELIPALQNNEPNQKVALANGSNQVFLTDDQVNTLVTLLKNKEEEILPRIAIINLLGKSSFPTVIPALIQQLNNDNQDVRQSTVEALSLLGSEDVLPALIQRLKIDKNIEVRQSIVKVLGLLGRENALPALIQQLKNDNEYIQQNVARTLGLIGSKDALSILIEQFKDDKNDVRESLIQALGAIGSEDALPALIDKLKKTDDIYVQQAIVQALRSIGSKDALPVLIQKLKSTDDAYVRQSVLEALIALGGKEALLALIQQFKNADNVYVRLVRVIKNKASTSIQEFKGEIWLVQQSVANALGLLGSKDALPALIDQLKNDNKDVRKSVVEALGLLGYKDALPFLIQKLKDDNNKDVRRSIIDVISSLGSKEALPALIQQLKNDDKDVQQSLIETLSELGNEDALSILLKQLKDSNKDVQKKSAYALARLDSKDILPILIQQLKDDDSKEVKQSITEAIVALGGKDALAILIHQLQDNDEKIRKWAANLLGFLGSKDALSALIRQLKDDNSDVRNNVANALGLLGSKDSLSFLIQHLRDDNKLVRQSVAIALGRIGSKDALPMLIRQLKDDDSNVRQSVVIALSWISRDNKDVLPVLIQQLKDKNKDVRYSVAQALSSFDSKDVLPFLVQLLKDNDNDVRQSAAEALGLIGSKEALPFLKNLYQNEQKSKKVKIMTAISLLSLKNETGCLDMLQYYLDNPTVFEFPSNFEIRQWEDSKLQIFTIRALGKNPSPQGLQLLLQLLDKQYLAIPTQVEVIRSLEQANAQQALSKLYPLLSSSFVPIIKAAQSAITHLEHNKTKLLAMIENDNLKIPLRLKALTTLATRHQANAIPELLRLLEKDEYLYGEKIWQLLDKMDLKKDQAKHVEVLLHKQLETINQQHKDWRQFRDHKEPKVAKNEQKDQNPEWIKWKAELDKTKPKSAFDAAHMLARIDPQFAVKNLLGYNLASVRRGTWYGLASLGDVKLVQQLSQQFLQLRKKVKQPLLRHAIYRSIDLSLTNIQVNNQREDLETLTTWLKLLKTEEDAINDGENPVTQRVEWTIAQLDYHLNIAMPELERRYQVFLEQQKNN